MENSDFNDEIGDEELEDNEIENEENESTEESSEDEGSDMQTDNQNEQNYQTKLAELEQAISQNKFQYQIYIDILNLAKEHGEFYKLREYREKMSQVFPLTETLWLEWLKDEQKYVENEEDRRKLDQLFRKAVQDYLSVELWLEYIQYSIGGMGEENGVENIRKICEEAISFSGLHFSRGYTLWEAYREFETALLAGYQQSTAGSIPTSEQTKQINEQIDRILKIFKQQLSVCLDNIESTYKELEQFDEASANDVQIKNSFEINLKRCKELEPFETSLIEASTDLVKKLEIYYNYIEYEMKLVKDIETKLFNNKNLKNINSTNDKNIDLELLTKSQVRLKCLFERAIADDSNCLNVDLWLKYILYLLEEENRDPKSQKRDYNLNVFKRSIRNCPWSAKLWLNYALEIEKLGSQNEQVKEIYKEAMMAGLQTSEDYLEMWHGYLGFLKRSHLSNFENESLERKETITEEIRDTFQKAINQLYDYFKLNGDPKFSLERFWAEIEAKYFKSMEKSRKIYNEMILAKSDIGELSSEIWIDFYQLEIQYGDEKHQRKLLNRALNELKYDTDRQIIFDLLIKFERLNGNIGQFSSVYSKYEIFKNKLQIEYLKNQKKLNQKQPRDQQQQQKTKQKVKQSEEKKEKKEEPKGIKRKKAEIEPDSSKKQIKDKDGFAIPSLPVGDFNKTNTTATIKPPTEIKKVESNCTVFISNLKYDVDEQKVREFFEKEPGFLHLRLIKHWSGKTKGYGYVDFERPEQAEKALKLDRSLIDGRPVFVSKNEEKDQELNFQNQNKFKFPTNMEKNKLFVSGLPFSLDKQGLEDIFKTFGKLKEIRIVTYKSGKPKGLAYVEFEDEQSASKALMQTDGMLIGENQISVAISNPPKRKQPMEAREVEQEKSEIKKSLGSGSVESRSAAMTSTSFVPRSQQLLGRKKTLNLK